MSYADIASAVRLDGGVKRLSVWTIKQQVAPPFRERLSPALSKEITDGLNRHGILTLPTTLPTDQRDWVILIEKKSALGEALLLATKAVVCSRLDIPMAPGAHKELRKLARQV
ncbi:hypothetical protein [Streptomyces palmae]|uniref:Uncharacterized protein n=1 Tax=Streptomyces palmae TaxID=1701085 RepID=A0A4Z0H8B6_9ACTN|nr:hypothetical protein [Streptomyces palmae]TGB07103.1 hypothetical protein E4099_17545 [Streptomyces palmae]